MPSADELLGSEVAERLVSVVGEAAENIELTALPRAALTLEGLSLRERADHLRDALLADIPGDYWELASVVRTGVSDPSSLTGWMVWPVTSALALRAVDDDASGLQPAAFDDALALLAELTGRLTSEFAIRTLLRHDLARALEIVFDWTTSPDEHVRRLASEGTRPYLPWAVKVAGITDSPGVTVPLLDALYRDSSDYVRRSVANHLNDLSRDVPELVVGTARRWLAEPDENTAWVVRHGLRTLIKKGHPGALELLGYGPAEVEVDGPHLSTDEVPWGGVVTLRAAVRNTGSEPAQLVVDYVIHHQRANGSLSAKTFKLTTRTLSPGEELRMEKAHSFRQISTRRYYPGEHAVSLQINGVPSEPAPFQLRAP